MLVMNQVLPRSLLSGTMVATQVTATESHMLASKASYLYAL